ncbi:hypothetical protein [Flammeovirga sp. SJP92]|uniref:hypothetical protein n=1 Tax=Flammeovirga sp. SJP92 TaxID=1775430 RepID=UPI000788EECD|nr:hypothetical protein [Flammeovirga sp. SJP92]KXX71821.1 hypothetical protein AVL50_03280 [Flammeovirga sp. SJP92]
MKDLFIVAFICFTLFSCSKSTTSNNVTPTDCDLVTVVSAEEYTNAPSDYVKINKVEIEGNCLLINFSASGCSGDSWEVKLIDQEVILESFPPQRNLRLSMKNPESCEAYITKELSFDISNLQVGGDQVQLNIQEYEGGILYKY